VQTPLSRPATTATAAPSVSIVIPCYNYGRFLCEAIESALGQTRAADEVVLIDDGSTDCTPQVIARFAGHASVRAIHQANQGAIATFNRGIEASRGDFFVLLSADDRLDPRFLERTAPLLAADPRAAFAYTAYRVFGARHRVRPALPWSRARLARRPYFTASALLRRRAFDAVGGFSAEMEIGYEDWDLFLSLAEHGWHGIPVPEALFHYREHRVASRNSMSFRIWIELLSLLYRRHRPAHRVPLPLFLLGSVAEQQWLTARAAPRAVLRRLGTPAPRSAHPRLCLLVEDDGAGAPPRALAQRVYSVLAGPAPAASSAARMTTLARLARWTLRARYQRAAVYHARGGTALVPAALAATLNRALLVYEPTASALRRGRFWRGIIRLAALRVDALVAHEAVVRSARARGAQPALRIDATADADARVDAQRLVQLHADLLALSRVDTEDAACREQAQ
jgi:GT2 family glycosyltransferase